MSEWREINWKEPPLLEVAFVADYGNRCMAARWTDGAWHNSATGDPLRFSPIFWQPLPPLPALPREASQSSDCQHKQRISEEAGMGHTTHEVCADCGKRFA